MKKIQMVDLHTQYEAIKSDIDSGIQEVLDTCTFIKGGKVNDFQKHLEEYLGVKHVIPVGNGTDAARPSPRGQKPLSRCICSGRTPTWKKYWP